MIKSNTFKGFYRIAFAVSFVLALISSSFTGSAQGAAPDAVPVFPTAAFSQLDSGSSPNRVFTTDLNIFTLDASAKKITIWKKNYLGTQLRQFSGIADVGDGTGAKGFTFASPYGLAKHPTQNIIAIADKGVSAQRVSFYAYTETASEVLFTYLGSYKGAGVANPTDVAFFPNGDVAVSGNRGNGLYAYVLKLTGPYSTPSVSGSDLYTATVGTADGLDIDQVTGHFFIASASDHCIYEHDGTSVVRTYGVSGTAGTAIGYLNAPTDVSVWRGDSFAPKVVVADQINNRVTIFNLLSNNQVFTTIGGPGTQAGQFSKPYSVYVADEIAVADTANRRVQLFSIDTTNLDSDSITFLGDDTYLESSSATQSVTVLLGSIPSNNVVLNISGYISGAIEGPATLTIPAGANSAVLDFQTLNGPMNCVLSFAQSTPVTYSPVSAFFSVLNVAPTIISATATTNSILVGESLELTGVATDPSTADALTYKWTFDDGSSALTGRVVTNTFTTVGIVTVTLTVTDPDGGSDTETFTVTVGSTLTILDDASTYLESSSATQSITVLLGATPSFEVILNISGYIPGAIEGPATLTIPAGTNSAVLAFQTLNGPTNCTLSFEQSLPAVYSPTNVSFSVLNVAPTITSATPTAYTVSAGESLELTGVATDTSADVLTYTWTFDDGSSALYGATATNTFTTMGTVVVTLTVTDPDGGSDTATFEIEVESGVVPTIVFTAVDTESFTFKIPTAAKDNSFIVKIAPALSSDENDWDDWLGISSANLAIGGPFTETMLMGPASEVDVTSVDDVDDFTYITVDITWLYGNYDTLFFKVMLDHAGP